MNSKTNILRIDASANINASNSKKLGDKLIDKLAALDPDAIVQQQDLNQGLYYIDESWLAASFTQSEQRSKEQQQRLAFSDMLINEIKQADSIVLTTPMYNFGIPATLKSWIDLICRAGVTFQYTPDGPVGLIENKRMHVIVTTGGVPMLSPLDFVSNYLKQVFGFIGIKDINIIGADQMNIDADGSYQNALNRIEQIYTVSSAA